MGWNWPKVSEYGIAVRHIGGWNEFLVTGCAHTICCAALDMMRALVAAINAWSPIASIQLRSYSGAVADETNR